MVSLPDDWPAYIFFGLVLVGMLYLAISMRRNQDKENRNKKQSDGKNT